MADLESLEAIRRLMAIYAQLLDAKRIAEWGELFTDDARPSYRWVDNDQFVFSLRKNT